MSKKTDFEELTNSGRMPQSRALFTPILMHFAARFAGKTYAEFASDHRHLVAANLKCMDYFQMDMVGLISDPYRETSAFGAKIKYVEEGVPACTEIIVQSPEDLNDLKNPDVYKSKRTLDRIKGAALFQKYLKGSVPVFGWIEGPLAEACDLAGVSDMLIYLLTQPDFANRLLDKCVITAKEFAKAQIEAGCDIIGIGDAVCSQIDKALYDTFVKPRHVEIFEYVRSHGALVKLHICGDIDHLLPSISDLKPDILDLDWQVDLDEARKWMGSEVILHGNIDPVAILQKDVDEIQKMASDLLKQQKGQKFILSGGCEIAVHTPVENLTALNKARN